jgi:hypothetical protein
VAWLYSVQNFKHQYADAINDCRQENSFGSVVPMSVDVNGKQHRVGKQGQCANGSDSLIVSDKEIKKLTESETPVAYEVNDK